VLQKIVNGRYNVAEKGFCRPMPVQYVVKQGDSVSSVASKFRIPWKKIYYDAANAEFREKRPNPHVIYPGDQIFVPDREIMHQPRPTDKRHKFLLHQQKVMLRIAMLNADGDPLSGCPYKLELAGQEYSGSTAANGIIEQLIGPDAASGTLSLWLDDAAKGAALKWRLKINHLDPVEYLTGVQARLNNLGFNSGRVDGIAGPKTRGAVRLFQQDHGLDVDGIPGPITQGKLKDIYGC
jgi:N-acetylmuramoyl-L-alanine amidase